MSQTVIGSRRPAVHVHRGPRYDARSRHHGSPSPQRPALPPPLPPRPHCPLSPTLSAAPLWCFFLYSVLFQDVHFPPAWAGLKK